MIHTIIHEGLDVVPYIQGRRLYYVYRFYMVVDIRVGHSISQLKYSIFRVVVAV